MEGLGASLGAVVTCRRPGYIFPSLKPISPATSPSVANGRQSMTLEAAEKDGLDRLWMREALQLGERAAAEAEVPVGAVLVSGDRVIGRGLNQVESTGDPTAHAEMIAIRKAVSDAPSRQLEDAVLYVTLEPCAMCAGALVLARVSRVVFGARDPKSGACGSVRDVVRDPRLNHTCEVRGGVLEAECSALLKRFFRQLRRGQSWD